MGHVRMSVLLSNWEHLRLRLREGDIDHWRRRRYGRNEREGEVILETIFQVSLYVSEKVRVCTPNQITTTTTTTCAH